MCPSTKQNIYITCGGAPCLGSVWHRNDHVSASQHRMSRDDHPLSVHVPVPLRARTVGSVCIQFTMLPYKRVHPHLAQISGICLSHISLLGCRRRAYCVWRRHVSDDFQMTVSPRPKSCVRPHADRKLRPMANFVPTTVLILYIESLFIV